MQGSLPGRLPLRVREERLRLGDEPHRADAAVEHECSFHLRSAFLRMSVGQQLLPHSQTDVGLVAHLADLCEDVRCAPEIAFEQSCTGAVAAFRGRPRAESQVRD
jgi:hypothetical protein